MSNESYLRFFPYSPYDHQREAMATIDEALAAGNDVLFEGACGTGKTLAALVPALAHARETDKTVVITTNVNQQARQFIEDARAITEQEPIRAVVFRGKLDMCHIDVGYDECQALRDTTRELVEQETEYEELIVREGSLLDAGEDTSAVAAKLDELAESLEDLRDHNTCENFRNNLARENTEFYEWLHETVRTPEEIYEYADAEQLCGYELLKEGMDEVDLVVCNYHHVLDPMIREQFFRWLGRDPEDVICVFDEAHNIEGTARDHSTRRLAESTLDSALSELEDVDDHRVDPTENVISTFQNALCATYDETLSPEGMARLGSDWQDLSITNEVGRDDLTLSFLEAYSGQGIYEDLACALELGKTLDRSYDQAYKNGETRTRKECRVLTAASFIEQWLQESDDAGIHPVLSVRRDENTESGVYGRAEIYTCLPRQVTEPLFEELHASVLMSATLRPFDVLTAVLGIDEPTTMTYGEQFPEDRRRTYAVGTPALFASRRDEPEVKNTITEVLTDVIEFTPGNTLCFFPSYREAERYHDLLSVSPSTLYLDEPGTSVEEMKRDFTTGSDGVLLTSLWGTLSEGVSFDGDAARTVCVVGVPYPRLDDRLEAVQSAYDTAFEGTCDTPGWEYAVEVPTVRKTRQALGRVVRSPDDFGARILIDERYTKQATREMPEYCVRETFPDGQRGETIDLVPRKLKYALSNFYSDMNAWSGTPPVP